MTGTALPSARPAERLFATAVALAAGFALAQATAQLIDFWAFDLRVAALNGNTDSNAFSWVGGAAIAGAAAAFGLVALSGARFRRSCLALAALFAFLLADNRFSIHERLPHGKLLFVPLLGAAFSFIWHVSASAPDRARVLLRAGLGSLFVSLSVHLLGPSLLAAAGWHSHDWQYQIKVALKESTELAGWILVCFGALAFTRSRSTYGRRQGA